MAWDWHGVASLRSVDVSCTRLDSTRLDSFGLPDSLCVGCAPRLEFRQSETRNCRRWNHGYTGQLPQRCFNECGGKEGDGGARGRETSARRGWPERGSACAAVDWPICTRRHPPTSHSPTALPLCPDTDGPHRRASADQPRPLQLDLVLVFPALVRWREREKRASSIRKAL